MLPIYVNKYVFVEFPSCYISHIYMVFLWMHLSTLFTSIYVTAYSNNSAYARDSNSFILIHVVLSIYNCDFENKLFVFIFYYESI